MVLLVVGDFMNQLNQGRRWLAERPYIIAVMISVTLILWMASGIMQAQEIPEQESSKKDVPIPKVKVETRLAENVSNVVELYGRTEPDRIATLKAEISGQIVEILAERGAQVKKGQPLAKIAINDLESNLKRSKALLKQREIEYQGVRKLNADGYQGEVELSRAFANLEAAKAEIKSLEIDIANTVIRAPFDGVLNTRYLEQGDYVARGDDFAMVADLQPLIVRAFVTENQIASIKNGQLADVRMLNSQASGKIRYIASVADENTNMFKIEVAIDNKEHNLFAGISTEVSIGLQKVDAIKISPALLALDEDGNIGVKTVIDSTVQFTPIDIVKSESDGIWLTGLGKQADIITLGQGFVRAGDTVEAVMAP